jgi:amino acid transporter
VDNGTDLLCSDIPLVIAAFLLWKFIKGTKFVSLADIPIREALEEVAKNPEPLEPQSKGWERVVAFLWD